jgi:hypothetical protein
VREIVGKPDWVKWLVLVLVLLLIGMCGRHL